MSAGPGLPQYHVDLLSGVLTAGGKDAGIATCHGTGLWKPAVGTRATARIMVGRLVSPFLATLTLLTLATTATGQTNDGLFPQMQWNFSAPGARANAMGRSFIGIADDASASVTNPAGLTNLTRPQAYAEIRRTSYASRRLLQPDALFTRQAAIQQSIQTTPAFLNVTTPVGTHLTVGFSTHRFLDHQESFRTAAQPIPNTNLILFPVQVTADFQATAYSGSIALSISEKLSVGGSVSANILSATSVASRTADRAGSTFPANRFDRIDSGILVNRRSVDDTAYAMSFALGVFARPSEVLSFGVVYAHGPRFEVQEVAEYNPGYVSNPCCGSNQTPVELALFSVAIPVNVPHAVRRWNWCSSLQSFAPQLGRRED